MLLTVLALVVLPFAIAYVISPAVTFLHEMGHALVGLLITKEKVIIQMGGLLKSPRWRKSIKIGRLEIRWVTWKSGFIGFCYTVVNKKTPLRYLVLFTMAGPLASLLLAIFLFFSGLEIQSAPLQILLWGSAAAACSQFLLTAIPMHYPRWMGTYAGKPSDGATALILIARQREQQRIKS